MSDALPGGSGKGTEVDIGGLCHSMREEVEVPENIRQAIFLRHPGDEEDMEEEVSSQYKVSEGSTVIGCVSGGRQRAGGREQGGGQLQGLHQEQDRRH